MHLELQMAASYISCVCVFVPDQTSYGTHQVIKSCHADYRQMGRWRPNEENINDITCSDRTAAGKKNVSGERLHTASGLNS